MGDNKENIDKLFSEGFEGFEPDTPFDGWQAVKAKIAKSKQKKRALLIRWSAVCLAILLAFFAGYKLQYLNSNPKQIPAMDEKQITNKGQDLIKDNNANEIGTEKINSENEKPFESSISKLEKMGSKGNSTDQSLSTYPGGKNSPKENPITGNAPKNVNPNVGGTSDNPNFAQIPKRPQQDLLQVAQLEVSLDETNSNLGLSPDDYILEILKTQALPNEDYTSLGIYPSKIRRLFYDFEVGIYAGPSFPSRTVSFSNADEIAKNNVANEQLANTNSYGIQLSKRWRSIEYGIGFFRSEWNQTSNNIILQGEPSGNAATSYTGKIRGTTSIGDFTLNIATGAPIQPTLESGQFLLLPNILQEYQFLDIPVSASYYMLDKRFKLKLQLGVNNRFLTKSTVQLEFPDGTKEDFDDLIPERYSLQFNSGLGISYRIVGRWNLNLIPTYSYGLSPISVQEGTTTRQHQLSIFSGISYRF